MAKITPSWFIPLFSSMEQTFCSKTQASYPLPYLPSLILFSLACTCTSDLLLQATDYSHSLMQDHELGLCLLALEVIMTNIAQVLEGLVNVTHTDSARRNS